jgi:1,4-alpha-glucan branching enzyme
MDAYSRLSRGHLHDPFQLLGLHPEGEGWLLRAWAPDCARVELALPGEPTQEMAERRPGLFELRLERRPVPGQCRLRLRHRDGAAWEEGCPWVFPPLLGELDLHLISEGRHQELWKALGARFRECEGVRGAHFAIWAPGARRVSVVGDFNRWDGRRHPCRNRGASGVWELFIPGLEAGERYKFEIAGADGSVALKSDPLGRQAELRPGTASLLCDDGDYAWGDASWLEERRRHHQLDRPLSIYELHAASWRRPWDGRAFHGWGELADQLIPYLLEQGFTHVELLPVMEHPLDASWGYQVLGYYAPTARHGSPDELRAFVDRLHRAGLGVILDWVPAHFPRDSHGLARLDGSALYEHEDPRQGEHPDWGTLVFNYGRRETRNFLLANALYWIEEFHADGLRIDAVASMLYLDYSRREGQWVPNVYGGRENLEAIDFLRELNTLLFGRFPGILSIAEESTSWPMVSRPVHLGGLGFNLKWNMGWMNDTLRYFALDPVHRRWHHELLSFSLMYAWHENFVLVLSHDEVVHGKGSLLARMPGDLWQRRANLRLLLGWLFCHPGRKLLFMGGEWGQAAEWDEAGQLDWAALQDPGCAGTQLLARHLNGLLRTEPALSELDFVPEGFQWINVHDAEHSVYSFLRKGREERDTLLVVANATPVPRHGYRVGLPAPGRWRELLNTDAACYGGSNLGNAGGGESEERGWDGRACSLVLTLPPLGLLILRRED